MPTAAEIAQWRDVVRQMMEGACDTINLSGYGWGNDFAVATFTDTQNNKTYCVFMEAKYETLTTTQIITRVMHGWGTFIVDPSPDRELSIQIPHPLADAGTEDQGIGVFKGTNSQSFLMAGTHRDASNVTSTCQSLYMQPDMAHNVGNMFQSTVQELLEFYDNSGKDFVAIQFHGMGISSCSGVDVYLTHGVSTPPVTNAKLLELAANLVRYNPGWRVKVPGDSPSCTLYGSCQLSQHRALKTLTPSCTV